jgi:hypothetical protein
MDGGQPSEIVKSFASLNGMDVSPDGKRILFITSDAKNQFAYTVCDLPRCTNRITLKATRDRALDDDERHRPVERVEQVGSG